MLLLGLACSSVLGFEGPSSLIDPQGADAGYGPYDYISTPSTITPERPAVRNKFLTPESHCPAAAVTGFDS